MPSGGLHPGHEDSVLRMEDGLLGTPRRPGVHLRQWVAPSSTRFSPITPSRQFHLHFLGNRGIRLHLAMAGNYPRIPGITPGLGLVHYPLSFATHRFALLVQSGGSAPRRRSNPSRATNDMSQFRWFHIRPRRILLIRPAGLSVTVDDPMRRSHYPRTRRLPRVNSDTELQLTAPCSLLSLIRLSFRPRKRRTVRR